MNIQSPFLAGTNHVNEIMLGCYSGNIKTSSSTANCIIQEIFSRAIGLLISPAAVFDLAFHLVLIPLSTLYAIGKSIYYREVDFTIPWHHLQRVQDTAFPILFGSLFSVIHPYFGTYAAEPARKHIATGILLSGTSKDHFDTVCSPLTTIDEINTLLSGLPTVTQRDHDVLKQIHFWENELEKIQSIDFFNLNLTAKLQSKIYKWIDNLGPNDLMHAVLKRVSLIVYPIFMAMDILAFGFAATVSLGSLGINLIGGHSAAYLEATSSPEVQLYNIVKIPLFLVSATLGLIVSLVSPENGLVCLRTPMEWMAKIPFMIKMLGLKYALSWLQVGQSIVLPAVETFPEEQRGDKFPLLPSYGAHMRYLLIERIDADHYQGELIERGTRHGKTDLLTKQDMQDIMVSTLSLRYHFGYRDTHAVLNQFGNKNGLHDLGIQTGVNNCILTNLMATLEIIRHKEGNGNFNQLCKDIKTKAIQRYLYYAKDFYPFGGNQDVLQEIENILHQNI